MRTFRSSYTDRSGKARSTKNWYVEFRDHRGCERRLPAFADRAASAEYGRKLERIVALMVSGEGLTPDLNRWMDTLPAEKFATLARIGLVDPRRLAVNKPLASHLDDFRASLLAGGRCEEHVAGLTSRIERLCKNCGFAFLSDIRAADVEARLAKMRAGKDSISARTSNAFLGALKQFCRWLVKHDRLHDDPLRKLDRLRPDRRRSRRALSEEEVGRLLGATASGPDRAGLAGAERVLIYRLALETGMRAKELTSLRVASFALEGARPTVTLEAAYSKHRREDVMPLRLPIAAALQEHFAAKAASSRAFAIPRHWRQSEMLAADLAAAGVPIVDEEGRVADFHALRHTFITSLSRAGVNPKVAQSLARHSSIVLTMDHYTHLRVDDDRRALEALPFGREVARDALDATGTEGRSVFPLCLLSRGGSGETSVDSQRGSRPLEPR